MTNEELVKAYFLAAVYLLLGAELIVTGPALEHVSVKNTFSLTHGISRNQKFVFFCRLCVIFRMFSLFFSSVGLDQRKKKKFHILLPFSSAPFCVQTAL